MKYIKKFIRESYGLEYLSKIAEITKGNGKQSEFHQWQVDNAKLVDISASPSYVIKGNPKQKQCYRNAFKVASENYNKDILYVEGIIMMHGIPIEHAWNKIGDVYFDVTSEISGIKHKEYISIIELNSDKIWKYADETGFYGPFMSSCFLDTHINENYGMIKLTDNAIEEINKYETSEQLLRAGGISNDELDRSAYGFCAKDIKTLLPNQLHIKWKADYENVVHEQEYWCVKNNLSKIEWAKKINISKPVDVVYEKNKFYLDDGHHRYYAAKILRKSLNVNLEIKMNPIIKLTPNLDYDRFHRAAFTIYKK